MLSGMTAEIATAQAESRIRGVLLEDGADATFTLGDFKVVARETRGLLHRLLLDVGVAVPPFEVAPSRETEPGAFISTVADHRGFGLVILLDRDTLLLVGQNLTLDASIENGAVEVDTAESGRSWTVAGSGTPSSTETSALPRADGPDRRHRIRLLRR